MAQCEGPILNKRKLTVNDKTHPLNMLYGKQLSERSDRYRVPKTRINRPVKTSYQKSIVLYEEVKRITKS